jgi:NitT/TauT family transport system substrate-binding protein
MFSRCDIRGACVVTLLGLAIALAACGGSDSGDDSGPLKIGIGPSISLMQLYVAEDRGYLRDEGLDVDVRKMGEGAAIAAAVQSGSIDIGWANPVSIMQGVTRGLDYRFVAGGAVMERGHWMQALVTRAPRRSARPPT